MTGRLLIFGQMVTAAVFAGLYVASGSAFDLGIAVFTGLASLVMAIDL